MTGKQLLGTAGLAFGAALIAGKALRKSIDYDFQNKVVLITGGSRGLGLVMARELVKLGAKVAICARDEAELQNAVEDIKSRGGDVLAVPCDVTDRADVDHLIAQVHIACGEIDVLINNAGVIQVGPLETMTIDDFEETMNTHFWGALYPTLAVLPSMRQRRDGRIVNISSIGGKISVPHLVPYSASKFALVGLSEGLRAELAGDGITITTVCPGLMRTGSPRNATFKGKHRAEYAWFSISDALPVTSIQVERAARQIIAACKRGQAELIITTQAALAVKFRALFPEATADMLALANRLLPG